MALPFSDRISGKGTRFFIIAAWALLAWSPSFAQPIPPGVLPEPPPGKRLIVHLADLPAGQRKAVEDAQAARLARARSVRGNVKGVPSEDWNGVYAFASDEDFVGHLDRMVGKAVPLSGLRGRIAVKLSMPAGPAFSAFAFRGYVPEGTTRRGPWTWMARLYSSPDGSVLSIDERDYVAEGAGVRVIPEITNIEINGDPGELHVAVAPSGRQLWLVEWATTARQFHLYFAPTKAVASPRTLLLEVARSLE